MHMAKKKSFRSAPRIVTGREMARWTLLIRLASAICFSIQNTVVSITRKQPRQEIHRGDGHANAKQNPGKHPLRAAFTEGKGEASHDDGDEREGASDGAGEGLLQHADRVFPGGSSLRERGSCDCDHG